MTHICERIRSKRSEMHTDISLQFCDIYICIEDTEDIMKFFFTE